MSSIFSDLPILLLKVGPLFPRGLRRQALTLFHAVLSARRSFEEDAEAIVQALQFAWDRLRLMQPFTGKGVWAWPNLDDSPYKDSRPILQISFDGRIWDVGGDRRVEVYVVLQIKEFLSKYLLEVQKALGMEPPNAFETNQLVNYLFDFLSIMFQVDGLFRPQQGWFEIKNPSAIKSIIARAA